MTATYEEAVNAMFGLFLAAWQAGSAAIVGTVPEIRWQGREEGPQPKDEYWCRVSTQNVLERQATLRETGQRYTTSGILYVQLFCPMSDSKAFQLGRQLAMLARNAFRGQSTENGVWFRNCRINELPNAEGSYRFNIVVDYEFDEIG